MIVLPVGRCQVEVVQQAMDFGLNLSVTKDHMHCMLCQIAT